MLIRGATLIHSQAVLFAGYHHIPHHSRGCDVMEYSIGTIFDHALSDPFDNALLPDSHHRRLSGNPLSAVTFTSTVYMGYSIAITLPR